MDKIYYCRTEHILQHGAWRFMLDTYGYKQTLRIRNTYSFRTATTATPTRLAIKFYVYCPAFVMENQSALLWWWL